jgi:hypothetical protein
VDDDGTIVGIVAVLSAVLVVCAVVAFVVFGGVAMIDGILAGTWFDDPPRQIPGRTSRS